MIPRALYPEKKPPNSTLICVPACQDCNNELLARDQDYLRDYLVIDYKTRGHPIADILRSGPLMRSIRRRQSKLREAVGKARRIPVQTPSGIYLGMWPMIPVDNDRLGRIFHRMARGIYFGVLGHRLPDDCWTQVYYMEDESCEQTWNWMLENKAIGPYEVGQGNVCHFIYMVARDEPCTSLWFLLFYSTTLVALVTGPASKSKPPQRHRPSPY